MKNTKTLVKITVASVAILLVYVVNVHLAVTKDGGLADTYKEGFKDGGLADTYKEGFKDGGLADTYKEKSDA